MKPKFYTFRTFPCINELKNEVGDLFVFDKLKESFDLFKTEIENYDLIVGIAKSTSTQIETLAINRFNKTKVISKTGKEKYQLYIPKPLKKLLQNKKTTDSFCNWTMYKISEHIEKNNLSTKLTFIHINSKDIHKLSLLSDN